MAYGGASTVYEQSAVGTSFTLSINAIPANSTVVVAVSVRNDAVASGDLVSSVSSSPALATAFAVPSGAKAHRTPDDNIAGRQGIFYFVGRTSGSQNDHTFTVTLPNSGNLVKAQAIYFTGHGTSPVDQVDDGAAGTADASIATGPVTPTQAAEDVLIFTAGKWWWSFSSPSGFTQISSTTDNAVGKLPHWLGYKSITDGAAQSASWDVPSGQGDGGLALLMTLKVGGGGSGTKKLRIDFVSGSGINGVTGLSVKCWKGNPDSNYSQTLTGVSAEASGDRIDAPAPTGAGANGEQWEVRVFKSGYSSDHGIGTIVTV